MYSKIILTLACVVAACSSSAPHNQAEELGSVGLDIGCDSFRREIAAIGYIHELNGKPVEREVSIVSALLFERFNTDKENFAVLVYQSEKSTLNIEIRSRGGTRGYQLVKQALTPVKETLNKSAKQV